MKSKPTNQSTNKRKINIHMFTLDSFLYGINYSSLLILFLCGSAHGVMVIVVGNGDGDTSSNAGRD